MTFAVFYLLNLLLARRIGFPQVIQTLLNLWANLVSACQQTDQANSKACPWRKSEDKVWNSPTPLNKHRMLHPYHSPPDTDSETVSHSKVKGTLKLHQLNPCMEMTRWSWRSSFFIYSCSIQIGSAYPISVLLKKGCVCVSLCDRECGRSFCSLPAVKFNHS